jgi:hypothetical protein
MPDLFTILKKKSITPHFCYGEVCIIRLEITLCVSAQRLIRGHERSVEQSLCCGELLATLFSTLRQTR